uniref:Uncharacterized protein n=1 Tax=Candidatus Kentrum sp. UNK TaxID=2126344 RepID=A0A451AQ73_9GAMM|nr:MAG: hypothetical protein BECKUNK1418G_GA0071005_12101 [Candidatus Kentron sp. UNK]VFK73470.1 MAG: hypothetical protein BECKUNK1418H_GA0071006_12071 [Candidatus Kentron sp. UNK]
MQDCGSLLSGEASLAYYIRLTWDLPSLEGQDSPKPFLLPHILSLCSVLFFIDYVASPGFANGSSFTLPMPNPVKPELKFHHIETFAR